MRRKAIDVSTPGVLDSSNDNEHCYASSVNTCMYFFTMQYWLLHCNATGKLQDLLYKLDCFLQELFCIVIRIFYLGTVQRLYMLICCVFFLGLCRDSRRVFAAIRQPDPHPRGRRRREAPGDLRRELLSASQVHKPELCLVWKENKEGNVSYQ